MRALKLTILAVVVLIVAAFILADSLYILDEMHYAVVTQFGQPKNTETEAGLKWKTPFVEKVNLLPKRILEWDGDPTELVTKDKKYIFVDTWARWRIIDPLLFYRRLRTVNEGQGTLDDRIESATRDVVAGYNLIEAVRSTNRDLLYTDAELKEALGELEAIKVGRVEMSGKIRDAASTIETEEEGRTETTTLADEFGIHLVDVQINRVIYVEDVQQAVYARMRAERRRIAERYRSEGREDANRIHGETRRDLDQISSEGYSESKRIRAEGDARALEIYAGSYSKEPDFYRFWRTLKTYEKAIDRNTSLILSADNDYLKLLMSPQLEAMTEGSAAPPGGE